MKTPRNLPFAPPVAALPTAFALALALAACGEGKVVSEEIRVVSQGDGEAEAQRMVTLEQPVLSLPIVSGNPAALYFELHYAGAQPAVLTGISVEGAEAAMLHDVVREGGTSRMVALGELALSDGDRLRFEPGGRHGMVMGLPPTVAEGEMVEVTMEFADGGSLSFPFKVVAAGEAR